MHQCFCSSSPQTGMEFFSITELLPRGAQWLSGRASDTRGSGRGFKTYLRRVVSYSKTLCPTKVLVIHRLCPDMTEKLLTRTLNLNTNKQTKDLLPMLIHLKRILPPLVQAFDLSHINLPWI